MEATVISGLPILSIPFLSNTDATRQQMSAKQATQSISSINCRRPYVVGNKFKYYTENSEEYNFIAKENGQVLYTNDDLMVCIFENDDELHVFSTPKIKIISVKYATTLRYKHPIGRIIKGNIVYQYDSFIGNMISNGYNASIGFLNICGYNFEDAIVISESFAKKALMIKKEKVLIPIYTYSLFNLIYGESKHQFIPEVGQSITGNTISIKKSSAISTNYELLNNLSLSDISILSQNENDYNKYEKITTKLKSSVVSDIKVHRILHTVIVDNNINTIMSTMYREYSNKVNNTKMELQKYLSDQDMVNIIIDEQYLLGKSKRFLSFDMENLCYVIEIDLIKNVPVEKGTKITNRYANKGVVSLILPDHLCPKDVFVSATGIFSRMNLGQIDDGVISKAISKCEKLIIESEDNVIVVIEKLKKLAEFLDDFEYVNRIDNLLESIEMNPYTTILFRNDVISGGLYFESDNYVNIDLKKLTKFIEGEFDITIEEEVKFPKEFFSYIANLVNLDTKIIPLPDHDIIYNIFTTPMYFYRLKQNAQDVINARDFGDYSSGNKQPSKISSDNNQKSMRFGPMEQDALIGASCINVLKELRGVKSDNISEKVNLIKQMVSTGTYNISNKYGDNVDEQSSTKYIIDSLITFMTHNV